VDAEAIKSYQIHILLREISPAIRRRVLVRSDSTIADLHYVIQLAMGWSDAHLNRFVIHGKEYGVYHDGGMYFSDRASDVRLTDFGFRPRERSTVGRATSDGDRTGQYPRARDRRE